VCAQKGKCSKAEEKGVVGTMPCLHSFGSAVTIAAQRPVFTISSTSPFMLAAEAFDLIPFGLKIVKQA